MPNSPSDASILTNLLDGTETITAVILPDGTMSKICRYGSEFVGYTEQEIASEPYFWSRFVSSDEREKVTDIIAKAKKGEVVAKFQTPWLSKYGEPRTFNWTNTLVQDCNGEMEYLLVVGIEAMASPRQAPNTRTSPDASSVDSPRSQAGDSQTIDHEGSEEGVSVPASKEIILEADITESKESLTYDISELLNDERNRLIFDHLTGEVHVWELVRHDDGTIKTWKLVYVNLPALNSWGRSSLEEIKGKTTDEIFGDGATDHYLDVVTKIVTEGTPHTFHDYFPNLAKHFQFTSISLGEYFVTTGSDITKLIEDQQRIEKDNVELELRVQERTAELKRSNQDLEDFAYVASHDLRAPLRKVTAFIDLLLEKVDSEDDEVSDLQQRILRNVDSMRKLIDDLLIYARANYGDTTSDLVDLNNIVSNVLEMNSTIIEEENAVVEASDLPEVNGNQTHFTQLFQNLITNAICYRSVERKPHIIISAEKLSDHWLIKVRDNGRGISKESLEAIFKPFVRLGGVGGSKNAENNTGLGLAICQRIVGRLGGSIACDSELGVGTEFKITLPLCA